MYLDLHVKYPLFLSDFNGTWFISTKFRLIFKYQIARVSIPVGYELFYADGRTDGQTYMSKLLVEFLNFTKASKKKDKNIYLLFTRSLLTMQ
jgi:hypothetical protein